MIILNKELRMLITSTIVIRTDSLEVFPRYHAIPFSKMLTFYRTGPFTLDASYNCSEILQDKSCLGKIFYKELFQKCIKRSVLAPPMDMALFKLIFFFCR